jgi:hypothetical protein
MMESSQARSLASTGVTGMTAVKQKMLVRAL